MFSFSIIKRIFGHARQYWPHLAGIFVLNLLAVPLVLLKPLALKILIDSGFGNHPLPAALKNFLPQDYVPGFEMVVLMAAALVIIVALFENLYVVIIWMLNTYTGEKLVLNFRSHLFDHVQRMSLAYHDTKGISDSLYRVQYDTVSIKTFLISNLSPIITSFVTLVAMIGVMFTIHAHFAWIVIAMIPLLVFLTRKSTAILKKDWKTVKKDESSAMSVVNEVLSSILVVKSFGKEDEERDRFMGRANRAVKGQLKVARTASSFYMLVGMIFAVCTAIFIYVGAQYVRAGAMTLGDLTLVIAYLAQIYAPIEKISRNMNEIQSSMTSVERVFALLDEKREVVEDKHPQPLHRIRGEFIFKKVSFAYDAQRPVIKNISFTLQAGDRVGIIGSTGAGKSTLMSLLARFYDPQEGTILVDGTDIKNYRVDEYRKQFGIVLQEPVLFSTSIAENIAYGRSDAGMEEIIAAAKNANAHDFIMKYPEGYDTLVGERGMQLSGGERQRISIARAFIKNAPVLILDEPTSSVDIHTEALIIQAMEQLMKGRNSFLITHRLDSLHLCNVIMHIEDGKIVEIIRDPQPELIDRKKMVRLLPVQ